MALSLSIILSSIVPSCLCPVKVSPLWWVLLTPYLPGQWLWSPFVWLVDPHGVRSLLLVMEQNEQWVPGQQLGLGWASQQLYGLEEVTLPSRTSLYAVTIEELT